MDKLRVPPIIQTRISPPKAAKNIVSRNNIVKQLLSSEDRKLVLVSAPGGYGKTTIVNEFILQSGNTAAWVHIKPDIKTVFDLIAYITASINRLNAGFGAEIFETIHLLQNDSEKITDFHAALSEITALLINKLVSGFNNEVVLVLDDFHELQNETNSVEFLNLLISDMPDNLQLVLISRHIPSINLSHLRAKRQMLEITQKDLAFTKEETSSLAAGVYSKKITGKELDYLESFAGGWVTGIHLILQSMGSELNTENELSQIPINIFDYFADEIFNKLSSDVRDFLLKTSHLENFDADICNNILETKTAGKILDYLMGKNIFLESKHFISTDGFSVLIFDFVQLFRTFLAAKAKELLPEKEQRLLMLKTSLYYSSIGNPEKAIDYAILSGQNERAETLIIEIFDELFGNGRFEKLRNWVNSLDEIESVRSKYIFYYKGILKKYFEGDLDAALSYLDKSIGLSISESNEDEDFTITAQLSRLEIMVNQGKKQEALSILLALEKKKTSVKNKAKINYFLGNIHFQNNDHEKSLKYSNIALDLCREINDKSITEDIYNLLGNINIIRGEFVHSIHYYELTLSMTSSLHKKLICRGNLGILYSRSGKFLKARECYNETVKLLRFFNSPIFELLVKMTEYTSIFEAGDYVPAIKLAEEINKLSLKLKNRHYIYLSYQFLGECSYYMNNRDIANNYLDISEKYMNESTASDKMVTSLIRTKINLENMEPVQTEMNLTRINGYMISAGSNYDRSITEFYLAKHYLNNNQPDACKLYLSKVLKLSKEKGYFSFLLREFLRSEKVFNLADNSLKDIIKELLTSKMELTELDWLSDDYRNQLRESAENTSSLKLFAFGGLRLVLNGQDIPEKKWIRKNRKLLLCYLLISNNRALSKDKIIDVFYGNTPVESADNSFHQAVSNLRSALKQKENIKAEKTEAVTPERPDFILYEDKTLRLNPDYSYYTDLEDFDKLVSRSDSVKDDVKRIEFLLKAVTLYTGNVLEGYYDVWCENLRELYRNKFIRISEILLKELAAQNRTEEIIEHADKLNRADNLNIVSLKESIKAYVKLGKTNFAKNKIKKYITDYEKEIGTRPSQSEINALQKLIA